MNKRSNLIVLFMTCTGLLSVAISIVLTRAARWSDGIFVLCLLSFALVNGLVAHYVRKGTR